MPKIGCFSIFVEKRAAFSNIMISGNGEYRIHCSSVKIMFVWDCGHSRKSRPRSSTGCLCASCASKFNCYDDSLPSSLNTLPPKSANWHTTSIFCEYLMGFYEFLPQKLSCQDLLVEVIKLCPPPIKDMDGHPTSFLVLAWMEMNARLISHEAMH